MKILIWIPVGILIGLIEGLMVRSFGITGLGVSLVIVAVVSLYVLGDYPASIILLISAGFIKALVVGHIVGWFGLFGTLAIVVVGLIRYLLRVKEKWVELAIALVLLISLYFFYLLVARNFAIPGQEFLGTLTVGGVIGWVVLNVFLGAVFYHLFRFLSKWINED